MPPPLVAPLYIHIVLNIISVKLVNMYQKKFEVKYMSDLTLYCYDQLVIVYQLSL